METASTIYRIEVVSSLPNRAEALLSQLPALGIGGPIQLKLIDLYFLEGQLRKEDIDRIARTLVSDPVTDHYQWEALKDRVAVFNKDADRSVEVVYRAGVTDNAAAELLGACRRLGIDGLQTAATARRYAFSGNLDRGDLHRIAKSLLVNDTIQRYALGEILPEFVHPAPELAEPLHFDLSSMDDPALLALSADRRLALDLNEMRFLQDEFRRQERPATDAELETLAQTWSEHCVHKTFKAKISLHDESGGYSETLDSIIKTYLQSATEKIGAPWVRSAFVDNAGVIAFDEDHDISFKVETHNHPSAIEPFGGANTGVGGVVRDVLGVSHRPIANTDVLCFGPFDQAPEDVPEGVLHPRRIRDGVVAGIEDYGNKLGLPTVNGAIIYHEGYTANPLVYCGSVGIGPTGSHRRHPKAGDRVVVIGGRTGRDGLRGATFSSLTMDAQTGAVAGASVQIGDPITEKGLLEVVERARDAGLYSAITDCGAGGLSSAVGEMGEATGAYVDLALVPLKYVGLAPWEIWLSEAQERMVLAVPPENLAALREICETFWVELSDIGYFGTPARRLLVVHGGIDVVNLDMGFLHACPRLELKAVVADRESAHAPVPDNRVEGDDFQFPNINHQSLLLELLSHPNIASKEAVIRVYDHEVRGATVVKPLAGICADGPSDAAVLKPLETGGWRGFALANGINPLLGEVDPYFMAISAVDEALRNVVAAGADPAHTAILDNFCWGDPRRPETLGSLVEAARGCRDAALHYGTPFISGKDSLNNEYTGPDGRRRAIPGTLLISSIAIHPDVRRAVTMDLKAAGSSLYLVGEWQPVWAGSHAAMLAGPTAELSTPPGLGAATPSVYKALHMAIQDGLVLSAHDLSEGGLAVAAAEMCIGGRLGLNLDVSPVNHSPILAFFGETNGCLLVEIAPEDEKAFSDCMVGLPHHHLGSVTSEARLVLRQGQTPVLSIPVEDLVEAFKSHV